MLWFLFSTKTVTDPDAEHTGYSENKLIYYEVYDEIYNAIGREKQLKAGSRAKKIELIEKENKEWKDLFYELV